MHALKPFMNALKPFMHAFQFFAHFPQFGAPRCEDWIVLIPGMAIRALLNGAATELCYSKTVIRKTAIGPGEAFGHDVFRVGYCV
jgi:hypothetical protein